MIKIQTFNETHIEDARELAIDCYNEERHVVTALPYINSIPAAAYEEFATNGLGVVMLDDDNMLGFLCCHTPWDGAFGTVAKGTFVPVHAHGAVVENKGNIYKKLYQAAADVWVANDIAYHTIGLYAHDNIAIEAFFTCGFGSRCVDAVRPMATFEYIAKPASPTKLIFNEIVQSDAAVLRDLRTALNQHLGESPCFMRSSQAQEEDWIVRAEGRDSRLYAAYESGLVSPVAFIEVTADGENFATEDDTMLNICGAFCLPTHRGKGIMQGLLNYVITQLKAGDATKNITCLGVDFESFNLSSNAFWLKHFTAYTYSVTRRIDECALRRHG